MDRFIDYPQKKLKFYYPRLKSNMDRFIGFKLSVGVIKFMFKIQYG